MTKKHGSKRLIVVDPGFRMYDARSNRTVRDRSRLSGPLGPFGTPSHRWIGGNCWDRDRRVRIGLVGTGLESSGPVGTVRDRDRSGGYLSAGLRLVGIASVRSRPKP